MKVLKEQETKLASQLWARIILVFIFWAALATAELYLFWQQYRRVSRLAPARTIPDGSTDRATTLSNRFFGRLQAPSTPSTNPLEPFD